MKKEISPVVGIIAVVGLLAVIIGAFVYFGNSNRLTPEQMETRETLIRARKKEAGQGVAQRGPTHP